MKYCASRNEVDPSQLDIMGARAVYLFPGRSAADAAAELSVGDFKGDGHSDVLCRSDAGGAYIDYASSSGKLGEP